ncbi:rab5 gdp/gtp exchange factor [Anaeramoeba ignava]|uniref:Rab5 gdp/gtp exchange factor n=1 Tax=Anaeramoeba ignava TaxID=1746090 RepID=A0A9Q0LTP7_ANAIG|nr:rab5 gdp/gtp exchange factor [Anaeramoeba ignava]
MKPFKRKIKESIFLRAFTENGDFLLNFLEFELSILTPVNESLKNIIITRNVIETHTIFINESNPKQFVCLNGVLGVFRSLKSMEDETQITLVQFWKKIEEDIIELIKNNKISEIFKREFQENNLDVEFESLPEVIGQSKMKFAKNCKTTSIFFINKPFDISESYQIKSSAMLKRTKKSRLENDLKIEEKKEQKESENINKEEISANIADEFLDVSDGVFEDIDDIDEKQPQENFITDTKSLDKFIQSNPDDKMISLQIRYFIKYVEKMGDFDIKEISSYIENFVATLSKKCFSHSSLMKFRPEFSQKEFRALNAFQQISLKRRCVLLDPDLLGGLMTKIKEKISNIRGLFEDYIMEYLHDFLFGVLKINNKIMDEKIKVRLRKLSKIPQLTIDFFQLPVEVLDYEAMILESKQKLITINMEKTPKKKLECLAQSCQLLLQIIEKVNMESGADNLLSFFSYILLQVNPPFIYSNIQYIDYFRKSVDISMTKSGFFYTNLLSAVGFLEKISGKDLRVHPVIFENYMRKPESKEKYYLKRLKKSQTEVPFKFKSEIIILDDSSNEEDENADESQDNSSNSHGKSLENINSFERKTNQKRQINLVHYPVNPTKIKNKSYSDRQRIDLEKQSGFQMIENENFKRKIEKDSRKDFESELNENLENNLNENLENNLNENLENNLNENSENNLNENSENNLNRNSDVKTRNRSNTIISPHKNFRSNSNINQRSSLNLNQLSKSISTPNEYLRNYSEIQEYEYEEKMDSINSFIILDYLKPTNQIPNSNLNTNSNSNTNLNTNSNTKKSNSKKSKQNSKKSKSKKSKKPKKLNPKKSISVSNPISISNLNPIKNSNSNPIKNLISNPNLNPNSIKNLISKKSSKSLIQQPLKTGEIIYSNGDLISRNQKENLSLRVSEILSQNDNFKFQNLENTRNLTPRELEDLLHEYQKLKKDFECLKTFLKEKKEN